MNPLFIIWDIKLKKAAYEYYLNCFFPAPVNSKKRTTGTFSLKAHHVLLPLIALYVFMLVQLPVGQQKVLLCLRFSWNALHLQNHIPTIPPTHSSSLLEDLKAIYLSLQYFIVQKTTLIFSLFFCWKNRFFIWYSKKLFPQNCFLYLWLEHQQSAWGYDVTAATQAALHWQAFQSLLKWKTAYTCVSAINSSVCRKEHQIHSEVSIKVQILQH